MVKKLLKGQQDCLHLAHWLKGLWSSAIFLNSNGHQEKGERDPQRQAQAAETQPHGI